VILDAEKTLLLFMKNDLPDSKKFNSIIENLIQRLITQFNGVNAYGEMVDILLKRNNIQGTIQLENLWNILLNRYQFTLMCGYNINNFRKNICLNEFNKICNTHNSVIPTEDFNLLKNSKEQKRRITEFQYKEQILDAEIENSKKMERELLEQKIKIELAHEFQLQKDDFINTICHEIRNPLNIIYGINSIMYDTITDLDKIFKEENKNLNKTNSFKFYNSLIKLKENLHIVEQCSQQQKMIVDDVLDLSKIDHDKMELNIVIFHLQKTFNIIIKMYDHQIQQKDIILSVNTFNDDIWLKADVNRFIQIMNNLLSNAIKFTPKGGNIDINADYEYVCNNEKIKLKICITDTGIGMTEEEIKSLFKPFSQANKRISSEFGGTGLGLMICKKLVEKMNGNIKVESQKYQGSKFILYIICDLPTRKEINQKIKEHIHKGIDNLSLENNQKNILIVEDNVINQKILINYLNKKGYFYHIANNGVEAIEKYKNFTFNIILMDIEMPIMGGLEATRKIREIEKKTRKNNVHIFGISANSQKEQIELGIKSGMDGYLTKPYKKNELYELIEKT
jgi:signal transduction histidine kinase/CheY-like chemotaxis protein